MVDWISQCGAQHRLYAQRAFYLTILHVTRSPSWRSRCSIHTALGRIYALYARWCVLENWRLEILHLTTCLHLEYLNMMNIRYNVFAVCASQLMREILTSWSVDIACSICLSRLVIADCTSGLKPRFSTAYFYLHRRDWALLRHASRGARDTSQCSADRSPSLLHSSESISESPCRLYT